MRNAYTTRWFLLGGVCLEFSRSHTTKMSGGSDNGSSWADRMEKDEVIIDGNRKIVTRHELGDNGRMKKITKVFEIKRMPKSVAQRREWSKFGDAVSDGKGVNPSTTQIAEEVFLSLTTNKETLDQDDDPLRKLNAQHKMVSCRYCKGDHWSSKCPYKDTLGATSINLDEVNQAENGSSVPTVSGTMAMGGGGGSSGKYVPPSLRGDGNKKGETMSHSRTEEDQAAVRVTNLSEDARESDLRELFGRFGKIERVFLAKDRKTQQSKGFAFIHFSNKDDAWSAIANLNGYGYDHLILKVEWAKPSNPR